MFLFQSIMQRPTSSQRPDSKAGFKREDRPPRKTDQSGSSQYKSQSSGYKRPRQSSETRPSDAVHDPHKTTGRRYTEGRLAVLPDEEEEELDFTPSSWGLTREGSSNVYASNPQPRLPSSAAPPVATPGQMPPSSALGSATQNMPFCPLMLPPANLMYGPGIHQQQSLLQQSSGFGPAQFQQAQAGNKFFLIL